LIGTLRSADSLPAEARRRKISISASERSNDEDVCDERERDEQNDGGDGMDKDEMTVEIQCAFDC
jgi:hypothetical protein